MCVHGTGSELFSWRFSLSVGHGSRVWIRRTDDALAFEATSRVGIDRSRKEACLTTVRIIRKGRRPVQRFSTGGRVGAERILKSVFIV